MSSNNNKEVNTEGVYEYIPLKNMEKVQFYLKENMLRKVNSPNLEQMIPFSIALIAPRKRGKSFFLDTLVAHLAHKFQKVYIVSPSVHLKSKEYQKSRILPNVYLKQPDKQWLINLFKKAEELCEREVQYEANKTEVAVRKGDIIEYKAPQFLVVFDDCMELPHLIHFRGPAEEMAVQGRHKNGSICTSVQDLKGISPAQRGNAELVGIFNLKNEASMEKFYKEYIPKKAKEQIYDMVEDLLYTPYVMLMINTNAIRKDNKLLFTTTQEYFEGHCYAINL